MGADRANPANLSARQMCQIARARQREAAAKDGEMGEAGMIELEFVAKAE
jgi:hypothetical protein